MSDRLFRCASIVVLASVFGCSKPPALPVGLVEGTVTIDGEPQARIGVAFVPARRGEGPNPSSAAVTDEEGRYRLRYAIPNDRDLASPTVGDGAMIGQHTVMVTDDEMLSEMLPPPGRVPKVYNDQTTTPLRFEVKPGEQTIDIAIETAGTP